MKICLFHHEAFLANSSNKVKPVSRWVESKGKNGRDSSPPDQGDDALARIAKYVPTEILGAFTLLFTVLVSLQISADERSLAAIALMGLFLLATVVYVARQAPKGSSRNAHLLISPLAFIAWSYPISSSALSDLFVPLWAFAAQAIVIALSIFIKPEPNP